MPNKPAKSFIRQIVPLIADKTKLKQLEVFIESAKAMQQTTGIDLLNISNKYLQNLITLSIIHDNLAAAKLFINANVDINKGDMLGVTPLIAAIFTNNGLAVDMLIAAGADVNQTDVVFKCTESTVELIPEADDKQKATFKKNPDYNKKQIKGVSKYGFYKYYAGRVIEANDACIIDTYQNTPLQIACCLGRNEIFYKLLAAGASTQSVRNSLLSKTVEKGRLEILKALLSRDDQDINFVGEDKYQYSAVDYAINFEKLECLKLLLEKQVAHSCWYFNKYWKAILRYDITTGKASFEVENETVDQAVIEYYVAKTLKSYLDNLLNQPMLISKNMVDFHFNYNTEVACQFVKKQLSYNSPVPSSPSLAVNSYQVVLTESELRLLLKLLYQLKIAPLDEYEFVDLDEKERHRQHVVQRGFHLNKLYLAIGEYLVAKGIPAAYNFLCKTDALPADKLRVNMLYKKIMELKDVKPQRTFSKMTLALLQTQYPAEYADAEKQLLAAGQEWLDIPQHSDSILGLFVPQQTSIAKRTGSPLHARGDSKAARHEEKIQAVLPKRTP